MGIAPGVIVDPPVSPPSPYSLIESVPEGDAADRWEAGFVFQPENCAQASTWAPCGVPGEVDRIVVDAESGTWTITFDGQTTAALAFDASGSEVQTALEDLSNIAPGDVRVGASLGGVYYLTWSGNFLGDDVSSLVSVTDVDLDGGETGSVTVEAPFYAVGDRVIKSDDLSVRDDVEYEPFYVEIPFTCSSFGFEGADYAERAKRMLDATLSQAVEREFWTGEANPSNPSLVWGTPNDDEHVVNPGGSANPTAVSPQVAIMLLAGALGRCGGGGVGVIHATPEVVTALVIAGAVIFDGDILRTPRGDIVVSGDGYPGTGPIGQPAPGAGQAWMYATGMVNAWVGERQVFPDDISEAIDRSTNTVTFRGEAVAAVAHDGCCSFAVLVDFAQMTAVPN